MSRTVAAVAVLLAALMHLLACAHGPESRASAQSDAVPTVRVAFAQPGAFSLDPACRPSDQAPGHDHEPHCCGGDEPTIQAPREVARALQTVQEALPVTVPASGSAHVPPSAQPAAAETAAFSVGPSPARLGVWRT
ncbi:hypothetical protein [Streptomyces diastatochromogenes]|uniref:hypothetical protein n=1 Tax=Streptomyces diastatochromogenes TaxID=42236 RepID=UPI0036B225F7